MNVNTYTQTYIWGEYHVRAWNRFRKSQPCPHCDLKLLANKLPDKILFCSSKPPQFSSVAQSCLTLWTPWNAVPQAPLSFTVSQSLLRFMTTESVMPSNHLILCRPLFLLPSIFPNIGVFSSESALCIRWPKYWSFASASVLPMNIQC